MAHFYTRSGEKAYHQTMKDGRQRDTNIGDARKQSLVPSSTGVIGQLDNYFIMKWRLEKMLEASLGRNDVGEIWNLYNKLTTEASTRGSIIHDKLETFYKTGELQPEDEQLLCPVLETVNTLGYSIAEAEVSFADELGYGGQIDLILHPMDNEDKPIVIIDFKTKEGNIEKLKKSIYDSYIMQLASYRWAIDPTAECYNLMISVDHPGVTYLHKYTEQEMQLGFEKFCCLLDFWQLQNNYNSSFQREENDIA